MNTKRTETWHVYPQVYLFGDIQVEESNSVSSFLMREKFFRVLSGEETTERDEVYSSKRSALKQIIREMESWVDWLWKTSRDFCRFWVESRDETWWWWNEEKDEKGRHECTKNGLSWRLSWVPLILVERKRRCSFASEVRDCFAARCASL